MRYDLWRDVDASHRAKYLGGAQTKAEALGWARAFSDRESASVIIRTPSGMTITRVTPRGARSALTRSISHVRGGR